MIDVLWLLLIPLIWAIAAHFLLRNTVTMQEAAVNGGIGAAAVIIIYVCIAWSSTHDTQILNGVVTAKQRNKVSCSHSYDCMCVQSCSSDGRGGQSCTQICQTCYDHSYDVDWDVYTTIGDMSINRVDRQGLDQPPRWTAVKPGEPASRESSYKNYLLAAPDSLFNMKLTEAERTNKASIIPAYPKVYDYYRVHHAITVNANVPTLPAWDLQLGQMLRTLGAAKQVNVNVVFVSGQGREYKQVLERAWLGGKKNDVTVIIGVEAGGKIGWVEAFTFAKTDGNAMVAVQMRDRLQALGHVNDPAAGVKIIGNVIAGHFKRKPMESYAYLAEQGGPSTTAIFWLIFVVIVILAGTTFAMHRNDVTGSSSWRPYQNGRFRSYDLYSRRW
jgi:hypothetical protein